MIIKRLPNGLYGLFFQNGERFGDYESASPAALFAVANWYDCTVYEIHDGARVIPA